MVFNSLFTPLLQPHPVLWAALKTLASVLQALGPLGCPAQGQEATPCTLWCWAACAGRASAPLPAGQHLWTQPGAVLLLATASQPPSVLRGVQQVADGGLFRTSVGELRWPLRPATERRGCFLPGALFCSHGGFPTRRPLPSG